MTAETVGMLGADMVPHDEMPDIAGAPRTVIRDVGDEPFQRAEAAHSAALDRNRPGAKRTGRVIVQGTLGARCGGVPTSPGCAAAMSRSRAARHCCRCSCPR